jgi:hypothetical protein
MCVRLCVYVCFASASPFGRNALIFNIQYSRGSQLQRPHGLRHELFSPAQTLGSCVSTRAEILMSVCAWSITILDIMRRLAFPLKHGVSESERCLHLQAFILFVPSCTRAKGLCWADPPSKESYLHTYIPTYLPTYFIFCLANRNTAESTTGAFQMIRTT